MMKPNLLGKKIAFYILIIVVWQAIDSADIWPDNIFPSPIEVGEILYMEYLMEVCFMELVQACCD